ncbi:Spo0E family sporulation regulatory protein-aspartic acid phosphatase [Aneurinibacillus sp. Ricciae_BoGa-3]|uniref:Spo0E family sporulation regulatory protein-aspartic acid phosphatase n=1 Tax=Aneurinibacillus sp. Ricciae_BoGa-3 TaxID=3022697 RepID=UPI00233FC7F5|nr:Spo0E family sporulation regulatory protein-aspartic acid phosphatase [Aneurinibacillus sp. Ricciae_BoGa-3]WCK56093.1 Spo0E family sporulation regulatory protein-aspartic acid phosphatase [Aneurinibacillus sp. Ricciae_BoGa-3]
MEEERIIRQIITEKRKCMHLLYNESNQNLLDEKVLEKSMEIDKLINQIMKSQLAHAH